MPKEFENEASLTAKRSNASKFVGAGLVGLAFLGTQASAALTAPTIRTTDYETIAGAVLAASAIMWGIWKAIGMVRVR